MILETPDQYWMNYGFSESQLIDIKKTYQAYQLFLETYSNKIQKNGATYEKLYHFRLLQHIGTKIPPKRLQYFGIYKLKDLISHIQDTTQISFSDIKLKYANIGTKYTSETELISHTMNNILELYEKTKNKINDSTIIIPEPHKIKIKQMPYVKQKWSSKSNISGRYLFLNTSDLNLYRKESMMQLCARKTIPGHMMLKENVKSIMTSHVTSYPSRISDNVMHLLKMGTKSFNVGYSIFMETFVSQENDKIVTFLDQILDCVRLIIDTGINSSNVDYPLTIENAKTLYTKYTLLSPTEIDGEILRCLAEPASLASHCVGREMMEMIHKKILEKQYSDVEFLKILYSHPYPFNILLEYVVNDLPINK